MEPVRPGFSIAAPTAPPAPPPPQPCHAASQTAAEDVSHKMRAPVARYLLFILQQRHLPTMTFAHNTSSRPFAQKYL
jgi:hypothetical protein